jgi:hypothetical protein
MTFQGSINNSGTLNWAAGDMTVSGTLTNSGTLNIRCNNTLSPGVPNASLLLNQGTLQKTVGGGATTIATGFENTGNFSVAAGTVSLTAGGQQDTWNTAKTYIGPGTTLQVPNGNYTVATGITPAS